MIRTESYIVRTTVAITLATACVFAYSRSAVPLEYLGTTASPSAGVEIVAYDARTHRIYATSGTGVDIYAIQKNSNLNLIHTIDLTNLFGADGDGKPRINSVSSVAIDPISRGFGAAVAIPTESGLSVGLLVLFDVVTSKVLCTLPVGYHPDMVAFSPNGDYLLVANEGQASEDLGYRRDPEGSVSVIDLKGKRINQLGSMTVADVKTIGFSPGNLDRPEDLKTLRIDPANRENRSADPEPEYITFAGGQAFVSLQENNAVGVLDLATLRWSRVIDLGGVEQLIDASDKDGIAIRDEVFGLHMPDAIAAFEHDGKHYFVTANEGDPRKGVAGEEIRVGEIALDRFSPELTRQLNARYQGNFQDDKALGRLVVSTLPGDSDTDGDGKIDRLTMYGTRSFSIFEADTGRRIFDSGSDFAFITADALPDQFNGQDNDSMNADKRSAERGSEPEGLAITEINGRRLCAIGLERVGGVMLYDLTDPTRPVFLQYIHSAQMHGSASSRPEGMTWIKPSETNGGKAFLVVAYEGSGTIDLFELQTD
ncbi:MAG: choice-of-anchor I family protein [Planctomycetota bacterium]